MKYLNFLGSVRDSTPPKPERLDERASKVCEACLNVGYPDIQAGLLDPLAYVRDPAQRNAPN